MTSSGVNPHRHLYDGIAEWYVRTFYSDWSDVDWLGLMLKILPKGSIVADIGCGPGQYARLFREHGHSVVSVDISERMLSVGRRFDPELVPVVGDISSIPLESNSLGGILAAYTLEHVQRDDTPEALESMTRALAPGGAIGVMVKCGVGSYGFQSTLVPGAKGYVQLWDLDDLSQELEAVGCQTVFSDQKAPISSEEFNHQRGFILARKRIV